MGSDLKNKFLVYLWIWDFNEMAHILKEHFYRMYIPDKFPNKSKSKF